MWSRWLLDLCHGQRRRSSSTGAAGVVIAAAATAASTATGIAHAAVFLLNLLGRIGGAILSLSLSA